MLTYTKKYTVPYYESDANGNMKLPSLFNIALQVSGEQSHTLGVSDDWLKETYHYGWVVVEYDVTIHRLPRFSEEMTIETFAKSYNKFFCYRDFIFYGETGEELLTINSTFVLIDISSRKVVHVEDDIVALYQSEKISKIIRGHKYTDLSATSLEKNYHVRFNDIDQNGHVNNSKYFDWMTDVLGYDFLSSHVPSKIHLKYSKEVLYGATVTSRVDLVGLQSFHDIASEGKHAQAEMTWREK
ncbi:acyl-[acyl-carrier-protein] thioesterase [Pseudolactococcus yaeyamensis]